MLKSELLQQARMLVEAGVTNKKAFAKLVKRGAKITRDESAFEKMCQCPQKPASVANGVAHGVVAVLEVMAAQPRRTVPSDALVQAGMALLFDTLDGLEQERRIKVDKAALGEATLEYIEALLHKIGPYKVSDVLAQLETPSDQRPPGPEPERACEQPELAGRDQG